MAFHRNPRDWTVDEVVTALCRNTTDLYIASGRPHANPPDPESFERQLRENDIDGATLIEDVSQEFLRSIGIHALGQRAALMAVIRHLQHLSAQFAELNVGATQTIANRLPTIPLLAQPPLSTAQGGFSTEPISITPTGKESNFPVSDGGTAPQANEKRPSLSSPPNISQDRGQEQLQEHASETVIVDKDGRKRRKITNIETKPTNRSRRIGFAVGPAHPVDRIFFGSTAVGEEILSETSDEEEGFQSTGVACHPEVSRYVYKRIRHFLQNPKRERLNLRGSAAIAIYPYRDPESKPKKKRTDTIRSAVTDKDPFEDSDKDPFEGSDKDQLEDTKKNPSVLVFQQTTPDADVRVYREDPTMPSGLGISEDLTDPEAIRLWKKYGNADDTDSEVELPGDDVSVTSSVMAELEEDEDDQQVAKSLSTDKVSEIMGAYIDNLKAEWQKKKLPIRESHAQVVWRQGRRSSKRHEKIDQTRRALQSLEKRLVKLKDYILNNIYWTEKEVKEQCASMDITVAQREEEAWKLAVWARQKEPPKVPRPRTIKPKRSIHNNNQGEDGIALHSDSDEVVDDNLADFVDIDEIDPPAPLIEDEDMELNPPAPEPEDETMEDTSPAVETADGDMEMDPSALENDEQSQNASNDSSEVGSVSRAVSHESQLESEPQTPAKGRPFQRRARDPSVIDLTLSPDVVPPRGSQPDLYTNHPENATKSMIESWDWEVLEERRDRKRIVLKILSEVGEADRAMMEARIKTIKKNNFIDEVARGVGMLRRHEEKIRGVLHVDLPKIIRFTKLYLAWNLCMHQAWTEDVSQRELEDVLKQTKNRGDLDAFYVFVKRVLLGPPQHGNPPPAPPSQRLELPSASPDIMEISSESEDEVFETPSKRRKPVEMSKEAKDKRNKAFQRRQEQEEKEQQLSQQLGPVAEGARVVINTAKAAEEGFIYLNPFLSANLKQHQIDGVRFMWREIVTTDGDTQGCLLAHTMGLGKTLQTIALLATIVEAAKSSAANIRNQIPIHLRKSQTLILCPVSVLQNWVEEINRWTQAGPTGGILGRVFSIISSDTSLTQKVSMIETWGKQGGVLVMGYEIFRNLTSNTPPKFNENDYSNIQKWLLESPTLIVADEAHVMKNKASQISIQTKRFKTKTRIALTGTPLANNLAEYYAMIDWVHPSYLGSEAEFRDHYRTPIETGLYSDSDKLQWRTALKKLRNLEKMIGPKVHRANISVLKGDLKNKTEFLITLPLTPFQEKVYLAFLEREAGQLDKRKPAWFLSLQAYLRLLCNCPNLLFDVVKKPSNTSASKDDVEDSISEVSEDIVGKPETFGFEDMQKLIEESSELNPLYKSYKMDLLEKIVLYCQSVNDRLLIFSQSIPTLDYIESIFKKKRIVCQRLDGSTPVNARQKDTQAFNKGSCNIYLISTRAGGVGLNLFGANRVVIFDFKHNPQVEEQAIGRAYRLGQQKPVFVYRFIVGGTFESVLLNSNNYKTQLAYTVVDNKRLERRAVQISDYVQKPQPVPQQDLDHHLRKDPDVLDKILTTVPDKCGIRDINTIEILHQEVDGELTAEEKQQADEELAQLRQRGQSTQSMGDRFRRLVVNNLSSLGF